MAKKKNISKSDLISFYMDFILEQDEPPKSVYKFAKHFNFEESKFYEVFGSFEAINKAVFTEFYTHTITALNNNAEYNNFDARNKLLSFYFTFFEILTANRSYVMISLNTHKNQLKNISVLSEFKHHFTNYIDQLEIETLDLKQANLEKIQNRTLKESAWLQLLITMKFWIEDTSPSFEKTDIFIEKSVNTSFDLLNIKPLKSVIDFGKFLFKEKMNTK